MNLGETDKQQYAAEHYFGIQSKQGYHTEMFVINLCIHHNGHV
jgi:hypothetical protein